MSDMNAANEIIIVYDGECPFCRNYVALTRLKKSVGLVSLRNAREPLGDIGSELKALGFDLDDGMAIKLNGLWYHGADCIHLMALLSSNSGWFNRLNVWVFKNKSRAKALYPFLRFFRNLTLKAIGRRKINQASGPNK